MIPVLFLSKALLSLRGHPVNLDATNKATDLPTRDGSFLRPPNTTMNNRFSGGYHEYFGGDVDEEAFMYCMLANAMLHEAHPGMGLSLIHI